MGTLETSKRSLAFNCRIGSVRNRGVNIINRKDRLFVHAGRMPPSIGITVSGRRKLSYAVAFNGRVSRDEGCVYRW